MIFGIIVFLIILICFIVDAIVDYGDLGLNILMGVFFGAIIGGGAMFFSDLVYGKDYRYEYIETERQEIYSIGNDVGIEGNFCLGSGHIESEMYYFYYIEGENGGIVINKYNGEYAEIIEKDNEKAFIIKYKAKYKNPNFWSYFWSFGDSGILKPHNKAIFEVPMGTIKYDYNISI